MGEVWSARDTRLDRLVALKWSSTDFSDRFAREARSIAALNHPGICTLFDVGPNFLVMELIEGRTLDHVIPKGGMRPNEALRYAVEIADAVAAAHAQGIVHRDLKPSNVIITPKGRVKVLDFGLAKLSAAFVGAGGAEAATMATPQSAEGTIVGTVAYMSPEQAQGLPVDARSDIFSFGVLLYEMLTGAKPFRGATTAATLAALIDKDPQSAREIADIPQDLERLVSRCLRKDPSRRPQTMADLHVALVDLKEDSDSGRLSDAAAAGVPATRSRPRVWLRGTLAAGALLAIGGAWWMARTVAPSRSEPRTVRVTNYSGVQRDPALSPDGGRVAFVWNGETGGNTDIYVKLIDQPDALRLTTDPAPDVWPTWSPDGTRVAFRRGDAIYSISAIGGSEHKIASGLAVPFGIGRGAMSWSPDGRWLAIPAQTGLFVLPADGGEPRLATAKPAALEADTAAAFSPDGRTLAFFRCGASTVSCRILLQSVSRDAVPDGAPRLLFENPYRAGGLAWSRDGRRLIFSGSPHQGATGVLWQVNATSGQPPEPIAPTIQGSLSGISIAGDRLANTLLLTGAQIWQIVDGRPAEPLLRSAVFDISPAFSPDGTRVVFQSGRAGDGDQIFAAKADGTGVVQLTGKEVLFAANPLWSPDGKRLVFQNQRTDGNFDVVLMDADGGPLRRLTTGNNNILPAFSRDGRRVWFQSNRTGQIEIWSVPASGGSEAQFTFEGRRAPQETIDGHELYSLDLRDTLYARPVGSGTERQVARGVLGFLVVNDGLYLVRPGENEANPVLHFSDLSGEHERFISQLPGYWVQGRASLSVSPDRRRIVYTNFSPTTVIQMVEGFR